MLKSSRSSPLPTAGDARLAVEALLRAALLLVAARHGRAAGGVDLVALLAGRQAVAPVLGRQMPPADVRPRPAVPPCARIAGSAKADASNHGDERPSTEPSHLALPLQPPGASLS